MFVIYAVLLLDIHKDIRVKIRNQPQKENFLGLLTTEVNTATIQVSLTDWGALCLITYGFPWCAFFSLGLVSLSKTGKVNKMDKSVQKKMLLAVDAKIVEAARVMELADIDEEHPDDQELLDSVYEERFHCGTCIVTNVMEVVYPAIGEYFDYLEALAEKYENGIESAITILISELVPSVNGETKAKIIDLANSLSVTLEPASQEK